MEPSNVPFRVNLSKNGRSGRDARSTAIIEIPAPEHLPSVADSTACTAPVERHGVSERVVGVLVGGVGRGGVSSGWRGAGK